VGHLDKNCPFGIILSIQITILPKERIEEFLESKVAKAPKGIPLLMARGWANG